MHRTFPPLVFVSILGLGLALTQPGCSDQPTPEQKKADAAFEGAKSAVYRGDYGGGREALLSSLALDEALHRSNKIAEETRMLGDIDALVGEFDSAFVWYERSLEEYKSLADRSSARQITLKVASLWEEMGENRRAYDIYAEALRLARVFHDDEGVRQIQWAMLPCVRALDEDEEQGRILHELLQGYSEAGNEGQQAAVLLASGIGKVAVREFDRAAEDFLRALMLADQARDSLLATNCSLHLATTFEAADRSRDAIANYADCLKRADRTTGAGLLRLEALVRVGNLYLRSRMFDQAARFIRAALPASRNLKHTILEGYLLLQLGHCDVESSREKALTSYRAGLEIFQNIGFAPGAAYACLCIGHLFQQNNQPTDALQYYITAIEQSEATFAHRPFDDLTLSCEQAYFGARESPWYDDAIDILLQLGRYDEAFWYIERRSNRKLFDILGTMKPKPTDPALGHALDVFMAARDRFVGADHRVLVLASGGTSTRDRIPPPSDGVARARDVRERTRAAMMEATATVVKLKKALEPFVRVTSVSVSEVQKALPPGTALVEHALARRALYAYVITNARSNVFISAFEKDRVYDLSKEFVNLLRLRESLEDSSRIQQEPVDQRLRELNGPLYDAFFRPIENAVGGVAGLLIVPPRELPALPLHALDRGRLRGGGYVAELHTVSYLPSAASLLLPRPLLGPVKETVALGYPGGTGWDVEYELRDIRAFFKDVRLYFEQNASLMTMQTEKGDLLHIALQFHFNDERPENSYVILPDSRTADVARHVSLAELLTIHPFPTIVISDLDDARTGIRPAEAYVFLAGGTQEVVLTSEPLSRKTKKYFGEVFYTALLTGVNSRVAYKKAQSDMIKSKDFGSPAAWAPFVLWGK